MILMFEEKYDSRLVEGEDKETICAYVLRQRIDEGIWYESDEEVRAEHALKSGRAYDFMSARQGYEYESFIVATVEKAR